MPTPSTDEEFFNRKRPWSRIKDQVIGSYMPPYLAKVSKLRSHIVLIDAFAGPGIYKDEESSSRLGSPLIMCAEAEKFARNNYTAIFCNRNEVHHRELAEALERLGKLITRKKAICVLGDSSDLLNEVRSLLKSQTLLLYLDPFGLKGCEFETIKPFLSRSKDFSTEIIINMSVPIMHRLTAKRAVAHGQVNSRVEAFHNRLTRVLGGDWWKEVLLESSMSPDEQASEVMRRYVAQLRNYLEYAGFCPVHEASGARLKYFITFCSRHIDALLLMNDIMCKAYNEYIAATALSGTMFEKSHTWKDSRSYEKLDSMILSKVRELGATGKIPNRSEVWTSLVTEPDALYKQ
jgi:three-Cys-motif partner protein